ncbi:MAG: DUF58 domain-containing protein [Terriglobales bacterium]
MDNGHIGWRHSLGAGLLLGLALGCAWLAHWTSRLYPQVLLIAMALLLALLGLAMMAAAGADGGPGWLRRWRQRLEAHFAGAGLPFLSVVVVLALAAISTGNNLLYLVVSALLAALLVSGATSALNLSGMELRFRLPEEIFAGDAVPVQFTLTNAKGFWPAYSLTVSAASRALGGVLEASMPPVYFAYLPCRQSQAAAGEIAFPCRGRYSSAAFVLSTRFPFGLVHKQRRFQASGHEPETLIYPRPLPVPVPAPRAPGEALSGALPASGAADELHRIRAHQPGDSARQVHWKASARSGVLQVREFSRDAAPRFRLRLASADGGDPERAEAALSRCAGWILALTRQHASPEPWIEFIGEYRHGAAAAPLWLPLAPAREHRRTVLDYLALVDPSLPPAPVLAPPPAPGVEEIVIQAPAAGWASEIAVEGRSPAGVRA